MTNDAAALTSNEAHRVRQGADQKADPDSLSALAADQSVTVRAALALNPAAPPQVLRTLADDPDERVRLLLARRLAGLLPDLARAERTRLQQQTYQTLSLLVADAAVRVRAAVADVIKQMPAAPRELLLQLAQDPDVMVSTPIIRFSPLLTTADLLVLITEAQSPATVVAVARRPGIDAQVSDAIAATADSTAIRALLSNRSAQIRETTLDALIARAADHPDWHEPLVRRPALPAPAALTLATIVATHLVEVLAERTDLPPTLADDLRARLAERLGDRGAGARTTLTMEQAMAEAKALARTGALNEASLLRVVRDGDARLATAMLSLAATVPLPVVERAAALRSAKGLVSLAWKAGFSMRAAAALQGLLGRLPPDAILAAGPGNAFPLGPEEMRWQLEFLVQMGR